MNGAIYRFCRKCGKQVNVSALEKYDKKIHLSPLCWATVVSNQGRDGEE